MIRACLFDLDGVVFDTEPLYTIFWAAIGKEYHSEIANFAHQIKGQTLTEIYEKYFSGMDAEQHSITQQLNDYERNMTYVYVEGFEDFIQHLKAEKILTAIVTSSNQEKMESVFKQRPELKDYFDIILTSEHFAESKPSPDCYLKASKAFGCKPDECVVFEDSINGLISGKMSGARLVGLSTTNTEEVISRYTPYVIKNFCNFRLESVME